MIKANKRNTQHFVRKAIYGRLVGASSNVIGRELFLTGPLMTVGRDSASDLIIRYVGVSRKHAVIREEPESGRFTISDMQSTNGVRVNGNAYGKVELRDGDYVDLGQVRFRFVGPGKDFVFSRDIQVTVVRRKASTARRRMPRIRSLVKTTKTPKRR